MSDKSVDYFEKALLNKIDQLNDNSLFNTEVERMMRGFFKSNIQKILSEYQSSKRLLSGDIDPKPIEATTEDGKPASRI